MTHQFKTKVYYADTDAYGVVWHGTYIRWMEQARTEFCTENGCSMEWIESSGYIIPVVNINVKYKQSAKLHDPLIVETKVSKIRRFAMTFNQVIKNAETGMVYAEGDVEVVAVDAKTGKLCRTIPLKELERLIEV